MEIVKTTTQNQDFIKLTELLDNDLTERYGEEQRKYDKYNKVVESMCPVIVYVNGAAAGCGAYKEFADDTVELKRVFVKGEYRGKGFGKQIIQALEKMAAEAGYRHAVLETGYLQVEAVSLYQKLGYSICENYPPYVGLGDSICMKKEHLLSNT